MAGGYLRTNWRTTNSQLDSKIFGRAIVKGSWYGIGAGAELPNGGFMMASVNASGADFGGAGTSCIQMDALSIMNLFYGSNGAGAPLLYGTSGYKFWPIQAHVLGLRGGCSATSLDHIWASVTTSDDSIVRFFPMVSGTGSTPTSASISIHFVFAGFIVSGPGFAYAGA